MHIHYSAQFIKQLRKAPQNVRDAAKSRLYLFSNNPNHPLLRNHKLIGKYDGCRSINITGDWRAVYEEIDSLLDDVYIDFLYIGTHSQLYR
jgi:addiction module RelE/StbE family toxin